MPIPKKYTHHNRHRRHHQEEDEEDVDLRCEERSLSLLDHSHYDRAMLPVEERKDVAAAAEAAAAVLRKHRIKWMRRPMVLPQTVLELLERDQRETAIRYLSNFLIDKREEDPDNYYMAGFLLYNSCATMTILLQEVIEFYTKMLAGEPNVRSIKRLANVLTLFQCVAANTETRQKFVDSRFPNYLIPLINFGCSVEVFENVRSIALSVIGILCQHREPKIIQWAIESDIIAICHTIFYAGSELNKVIAMHIIEAILQDNMGISYVCNPECDQLLRKLLDTWKIMVTLLATYQGYSPRLLFHIIRCYIILCTHSRGYSLVLTNLPIALTDDSFNDMQQEFPLIRHLLKQLLCYLGKVAGEPEQGSLERMFHVYPVDAKSNLGLRSSHSASMRGYIE